MKKCFVILIVVIGFGFSIKAQSPDLIGTIWKGKGQWQYWTIEFHNNGIFKIIDNSPYKQQPIITTYTYNRESKEGKIIDYELFSKSKSTSVNTNFSISNKTLYLWGKTKAVMFIFEQIE